MRSNEDRRRAISTDKSASAALTRLQRIEADFIVNRISEPLLAAKVSLRRLHAHMTQQELDLFKFPAGLMAQTGACAPKIVWSNIFQTRFRTSGLYHPPDDLRTESALSDPLGLIDGPKYGTSSDTGGCQPVVYCRFDPGWDRYRPNVAALAYEIGDDPMLLWLLQTLDRQRRCLSSAKTAA
jgi:hypothetical protein